MSLQHVHQTGQQRCYDLQGKKISCRATGQDGEFLRGLKWPAPRFSVAGETVDDRLTGLTWALDANLPEFPLAWQESLDFIREMNKSSSLGFNDWRLPNRRELRSLISYQTRRPALPAAHPFRNVFFGWYWSSTTAAIHPSYAWYVHLDGARMFYGNKTQDCFVWPVRGASSLLPETGQHSCYSELGAVLEENDPLQDGGAATGIVWPSPRFLVRDDAVLDRLTGLEWLRNASLADEIVSWSAALDLVGKLNEKNASPDRQWRLPNVNELESLVDCAHHSPALPAEHPFTSVRETYWSSTTSYFETDWAWAVYLVKGALGVGVKKDPNFHVWPVRDG